MNELIQIIKLIEPIEVDELNKHIDSLDFNRNSVFGDKGDTSIVDSIRTSTGTSLDDNHEITQKFHAKMNKGLDEYKRRVEKIHYNFSYYPIPGGERTRSWREGIQILQYEKTQEYKFHHDAAQRREQEEYHRKISVITYLTEDFKGGGTAFPHATYKPKPGYALIFPSNWCYPHAGEPVEDGVKRVAVTWYYVEQT
tara:strand:+ start:1038 stop:1628 length:591 start_codon:yes stop_codon:yes gene_type:complete